MTAADDFPRVLFITSHAFNHVTGGGVTFSNLFRDWPQDRLACVHNDPTPVTTDVCRQFFRIGPSEIRKWGPFGLISGSGEPVPAGSDSPGIDATPKSPSPPAQAALTARKWLFGNAEIPETVQLSSSLKSWISEFKPDVLYTILGNNALLDLIVLVRKAFGLPLVVHFMDDWKSTAYSRGLLSAPRRHKMSRQVRHLVAEAQVRLGIGDAMCRAYEKEFGVPFRPFQNAVSVDEWPKPETRNGTIAENREYTLFYGGAILPFAQEESLADLCLATGQLAEQGISLRLDIHAPVAQARILRQRFADSPDIRFSAPVAAQSDYLKALQRADLLLLPVNFDDHSLKFIRYSVPTKVPEYLFSGVPILAYGPGEAAQVSYARDAGWGHAVTRRDIPALAENIRRCLTDNSLRASLTERARRSGYENHDARQVRPKFRACLVEAARGSLATAPATTIGT